MMKSTLANSFWYLSLLREARAFHQNIKNTSKTQESVLKSILKRHQETRFGKQYSFKKICNIHDFQEAVPLSQYDDYLPYIERIANGEQGVLTSDKVILLEPTSGSTAASKLIPYTASLKRAFMRGIAPWIVNLFSNNRSLLNGFAYWSISPVLQKEKYTPAGIPIGFEEDSSYLGFLGKWLSQMVMTVPSEVRFIQDIDAFRYTTLFFLLRQANLRLISVWNPTFLTLLLKPLSIWGEQLADDVAKGCLSTKLDPILKSKLEAYARALPKRAQVIKSSLQEKNFTPNLWPKLQLLSCWSDSNAKDFVGEIKESFPHVVIQGKGLIATEAFISFPLVGQEAPLLSIRSHFFEFLDDTGKVYLAEQLEVGQHYSVVVTTEGLYRYQLFDCVEVVAYCDTCPMVRFVGKEGLISDHFGEKLNQQHVNEVIHNLLEKFKIKTPFSLLSCELYSDGYAYTLFIESDESLPNETMAKVLDESLCKSIHYAYCRHLGQLLPPRVNRVKHAFEKYYAHINLLNQRLGDVKPQSLSSRQGWLEVFQGNIR